MVPSTAAALRKQASWSSWAPGLACLWRHLLVRGFFIIPKYKMAKPANQNRSWLTQTVRKHPPTAYLRDGTRLDVGDKIRVMDQIKTITHIYPGSASKYAMLYLDDEATGEKQVFELRPEIIEADLITKVVDGGKRKSRKSRKSQRKNRRTLRK